MSDDRIPVFEIHRPGDADVAVALPASWASQHERVDVRLEDAGSLGWQACLESAQGEALLSFPWYDHVDAMLRGEVPSQLPDLAAAGGAWDDMEQGWWAAVRVVGDVVFVAQTDFDALLDVAGAHEPRLIRPGHVDVSGVEVTWSCVVRAAWDQAWDAARDRSMRRAR